MISYQLHLGDCLQYMAGMADGSVDAVITDPPYGIGICDRSDGGGVCSVKSGNKNYGRTVWDKDRPRKEYFENILMVSGVAVIWGGNYFSDYLPPKMGWLVWDKGQRNFSLADCELAWTSMDKATRIFDYSRARANKEDKEHPTQKPVALMKWCFEQLP